MGIYKKWGGKSSGSAPELQEKFPEKDIPNDAEIGKNWKKNFVKLSKNPKIGNTNKIMAGIFFLGHLELSPVPGVAMEPFGICYVQGKSFQK